MLKRSPLSTLQLPTYTAGLLQARAYRVLNAFMNEALQAHDLTTPQWGLIGLLVEHKQLRPSAAAQLLGVKPPVATRMIDALEQKGLIQRHHEPDDRRAYTLSLTPTGRASATEIEKRIRGEMRLFLKGVKLRDLHAYIVVLRAIAERDSQ